MMPVTQDPTSKELEKMRRIKEGQIRALRWARSVMQNQIDREFEQLDVIKNKLGNHV